MPAMTPLSTARAVANFSSIQSKRSNGCESKKIGIKVLSRPATHRRGKNQGIHLSKSMKIGNPNRSAKKYAAITVSAHSPAKVKFISEYKLKYVKKTLANAGDNRERQRSGLGGNCSKTLIIAPKGNPFYVLYRLAHTTSAKRAIPEN